MTGRSALAAIGLCAVTATACAPDAAPASSDEPLSGAVPPPAPCTAEQLTATLREESPGAGQRYATLTLTNDNAQTCTVNGFGDLRLTDDDGKALPTDSWRTPDPPPAEVRLEPGQAAHRRLHWTVVPAPDEPATGPCQQAPARLEVIPPDRWGTVAVPWSFGPVCQHGWLGGGAYAS
ncbi:DUF4232 domain-containing protein [Amycolatopsis suaedae]|nr:DUF4232 domain-containing protein [Amycolatopsis suaedae]